jgi:hypothetical protein
MIDSSQHGNLPVTLFMAGYNTNLAAEFYVLSVLHRLGAEANLTLGNKKSVDIVVVREAGDAMTVDVKGLAGKTSWPVDNFSVGRKNHFGIFVSFLDHISDPTIAPEVYVIRAKDIGPFIYHAPGGRKVVTLNKLRKEGACYKDAWNLLISNTE